MTVFIQENKDDSNDETIRNWNDEFEKKQYYISDAGSMDRMDFASKFVGL